MTCRSIRVRSADRCVDLRQKVCSVLRRREGLAAVPSPFQQSEILVAASTAVTRATAHGAGWHAELEDTKQIVRLAFDRERHREVIADLIQKSMVIGFEQSDDYWRLSSSTRYWYECAPSCAAEGIEMIPRISFASLPLADRAVGVAFDFGHLFRTALTVADFFDTSLPGVERGRRRRDFDRLRARETHKGTLLYDNGNGMIKKCYFHNYPEGTTCDGTGTVKVADKVYRSLLDYYQEVYPHLDVAADDLVIHVSFPGLGRAVPVAAKFLRLRVMLDKHQMPRQFRQLTRMPPDLRRKKTLSAWDGPIPAAATAGCRSPSPLWIPSREEQEQLPCPELVFGAGRSLAPPANDRADYASYFRQRLEKLRNGGLYRYEESVPRELQIVTPNGGAGWGSELQEAFLDDFTSCLEDISGRTFKVNPVRADDCDQIVQSLSGVTPNTAVVVFDNQQADSAAYYLLSHELADWHLKRLTRRTVERMWQARRQARNDQDRQRAERDWRDMMTHSVLKTLDRMDAVLWRLGEWPYDACLTIDVSEKRRYFAISLLICRDQRLRPTFWRYTKSWPKGDDKETINPEVLRDKIEKVWQCYRGSSFAPLQSLLVLRDGRQCGDEGGAILQGLDGWRRTDHLGAGAVVDLIDVHKSSVKDIRMWVPGNGAVNVLEGRAVYMDGRTSMVCCTGAATLPQGGTAEPCVLVARDGADLRRATRGFFALAQLNYTSPSKAHRYAQPLRETDAELQRRMAADMGRMK